MPWPLSQDYNEAIQTPAQCFSDPELQRGEAVTNALGLPVPCSGNFADVYAVQAGQQKWAVKCFTRQIPGIRERYLEISQHLQQVQLSFMVEFKFLDQGIRVRGQWYPILKMQWVEGLALNQFAKRHADKPQHLHKLCAIWLKMATNLRAANVAHGDLQHGNVLLVAADKAGSLAVKLIDYDGMCVPALELLRSTEVGHPSFQHPRRLREGTYGLDIDRFSHVVIYASLRALAVGGRPMWERYDNGDNLLFSQKDFEDPRGSKLFQELAKLNDPDVPRLAQAIATASQKPVEQTPWLEDLLPRGARPRTGIHRQPAVPPVEPSPLATPATPASPRRPSVKKSLLAAAVAACVLLVGSAVAAVALLGSSPPTQPTISKGSTGKRNTLPAVPDKGTLLLEILLASPLLTGETPPHAQIYLDGKKVVEQSQKQQKLEVTPGKHELRVAKEGFRSYVAQLQATAGKTERYTIRLEREAQQVARYVTSFQEKSPLPGWQYLWSATVGDPRHYRPLVWDGKEKYTTDGQPNLPRPGGAAFLNLSRGGGHPGAGVQQKLSGADVSVIVAYSIQAVDGAGAYRLAYASLGGDQATLKLVVHVNRAAPIIDRAFSKITTFNCEVGQLDVGDTIYVVVGPNGNHDNDGFGLDFAVMR